MGSLRELIRVALRRTGWVVGAVVLAAYVLMAVRGPQGIQSLIAKHREIRALEEQNTQMSRENDALRDKIGRLQHSSSEQELEIRKELKLLRPGETTFLLPDAPKSTDAQPQP